MCNFIDGVVFLHSNNLVHRNIKPSNLIITSDTTQNYQNAPILKSDLKIGDFSLVSSIGSVVTAFCGTESEH